MCCFIISFFLEPPRPPADLESIMVSSRAVKIQWRHASEDYSVVTKYIIQHKVAGGRNTIHRDVTLTTTDHVYY